jgi:fumarate reductase flavoprotein subunit
MKIIKTDIVIVGGGAAGLAAAVEAAENGASVTVMEKAAHTGGAGSLGCLGGIFAAESRLQKERKLSFTREKAFNIHMEYAHWRVDAHLVKAYIDKSAGTMDWLEGMGVVFMEPRNYSEYSYPTYHTVKSPLNCPGEEGRVPSMMQILTERAKKLGVQIHLKTPVTKILKKNGRVTGIEARDKDGKTFPVTAGAVIIATGGFGDNPEWIKKYTGFDYGRDFFSFRVKGIVGDGIRMAWETGSGQSEMTMQITHDVPQASSSGKAMPLGSFGFLFQNPNLLVNLAGERFMNEEAARNFTYGGNAVTRQKERCAFMIIDEATKNYYQENMKTLNPRALGPVNLDKAFAAAAAGKNTKVFVADSLEDLCCLTGIDHTGLLETLEDYNRACEKGHDALYHKSYEFLRPVKQPKFYAEKRFPGAYGTLGGILINYKTEVLSADHDVIPGLYAVGDDANSIYGDSYAFILPGNTMGFALNSGRIAAENALKYIVSLK